MGKLQSLLLQCQVWLRLPQNQVWLQLPHSQVFLLPPCLVLASKPSEKFAWVKLFHLKLPPSIMSWKIPNARMALEPFPIRMTTIRPQNNVLQIVLTIQLVLSFQLVSIEETRFAWAALLFHQRH